jgi:hypothetical protein
MDHEREPDETEDHVGQPRSEPGTEWKGRLVLVACSTLLSSIISVGTVSVGWKASIDTMNAVTAVKMGQQQDRIDRLDREAVRATDLVYRDQLLDAKLSAINIKIEELKEQISNIPTREGGRR